MSDVSNAISNQLRVLKAVTFREAKARIGLNFLGVWTEFGRLSVAIAVFSVMRYITSKGIHRGMEIVPFIATGVLMFWIFRRTLMLVSTTTLSAERYSFFPQVTILDLAISRGIVNIVLYVILSFVAFAVFMIAGVSQPIYRPAYVAMLLIVSGFYGLFAGIIFNALCTRIRLVRPVLQVALRILLMTSGVFFVIPEIPYLFHGFALWNPLLHLNDLMRQEYFGKYKAEMADFGYAMEWLFWLVFFALVSERAMRPRVERA
ncbi:ABC transporter permease [Zavarzinia aquatilis]|nr:ABC transporter permease [Zavarzinia aquatilis]